MDRLIDDFTTGLDVLEITSETKPDTEGSIQVDANGNVRMDTHQSGDRILGGTRRTLLGFNPTRFRHQPARLELGNENNLNLTVPAGAAGGMDLLYGTFAGTELNEDWCEATTLQMDVGAYSSFVGVTYAIVFFSADGGRSRFNKTFTGPPAPGERPDRTVLRRSTRR